MEIRFLKIFALLFCICIILCSCFYPDTDLYADYVCVDANLSWKKSKGDYFAEYSENEGSGYYSYTYIAIKGESKDEFIGTWISRPAQGGSIFVLTNPNLDLEIFKDWTVNKIQLYRIKKSSNSRGTHNPSDIKKTILSTDDSNELIESFNYLIHNGQEFEIPIISADPYVTTFPAADYIQKDIDNLHLRICFGESDNIVWDALIEMYVSKEDNSDVKLLIRRQYFSEENPNTKENRYLEIPKDSELYDYIISKINE